MITAILLKPLDGDPVGSERAFERVDFERLSGMGAVRAASAEDAKAAPAVLNKAVPPVANKDDLARLDREVEAARLRAADIIRGVETSTTERVEALGREVSQAEESRRVRLEAIAAELKTAEGAHRDRLDALKAEAEAAEASAKAADAPASDAGKASTKTGTKA